MGKLAILPEMGRGTMRSMVEGRVPRNRTSAGRDMGLVPLHHFVVPLPVPGRI